MSYLIELLCNAIILLGILTNYSLAKKVSGIDVDKLLKTVMLSQSFDEIADKIADKAVKKISEINILSGMKNETNLNKKELSFRASEDKNITLVSDFQKVYHVPQVTAIKNITNLKHEIHTTNGLSLKFKQFLKNNQYIDNMKSIQKRKSEKDVPRETIKQEESNMQITIPNEQIHHRQNKKVETDSNPIEEDISSTTNKEINAVFLSVPSDKNIDNGTEKKRSEDGEIGQKTYFYSNGDQADSPETGTDSTELDPSNLNFELEKPENNNKHDATQDSPSLEEEATESVYHNQSTEELINESKAKDVTESQKQNNNNEIQIVLRKEGNKLYTYEKSPDYEEYHQKLAKVLKSSGN